MKKHKQYDPDCELCRTGFVSPEDGPHLEPTPPQSSESGWKVELQSFVDNDEYIGHIHRDTTGTEMEDFISSKFEELISEIPEQTNIDGTRILYGNSKEIKQQLRERWLS